MPTRRQERVNARIATEVSEAIRLLRDPRIGFVTVTGVSVSPDLSQARVRISVLDEPEQQKKAMEGLIHAESFIRTVLSKKLELKVTPRIEFVFDASIETADEISQLIAQARASDPNPEAGVEESDAGE